MEERLVGEFNVNDFIKNIFSSEPKDPFSYRLELNVEPNVLVKILGDFVTYGSHTLYQRELALLSEQEIQTIRKYLLSIGYDVEYDMVTVNKKVTDYKPDGSSFEKIIPINKWNISFKIADVH